VTNNQMNTHVCKQPTYHVLSHGVCGRVGGPAFAVAIDAHVTNTNLLAQIGQQALQVLDVVHDW